MRNHRNRDQKETFEGSSRFFKFFSDVSKWSRLFCGGRLITLCTWLYQNCIPNKMIYFNLGAKVERTERIVPELRLHSCAHDNRDIFFNFRIYLPYWYTCFIDCNFGTMKTVLLIVDYCFNNGSSIMRTNLVFTVYWSFNDLTVNFVQYLTSDFDFW